MEKKLNLLGLAGMAVLLAVLTMGAVKYQRAPRVLPGEFASSLVCLPEGSTGNFRSPQIWNGLSIPPLDVTNDLTDPVLACLPGDPQSFQGIPVTGAPQVFPQYQYRLLFNVAKPVSQQYQYRLPYNVAKPVFQQYQYRLPF